MICPHCNHDNESLITIQNLLIFNCKNCDSVYYLPIRDNEIISVGIPWYNTHSVVLPDFKLGDSIMCVDNKHPLFLQDGFVKELDHLHARILFKGNKLIWMNQNIIARLPG